MTGQGPCSIFRGKGLRGYFGDGSDVSFWHLHAGGESEAEESACDRR